MFQRNTGFSKKNATTRFILFNETMEIGIENSESWFCRIRKNLSYSQNSSGVGVRYPDVDKQNVLMNRRDQVAVDRMTTDENKWRIVSCCPEFPPHLHGYDWNNSRLDMSAYFSLTDNDIVHVKVGRYGIFRRCRVSICYSDWWIFPTENQPWGMMNV